MALEKKSEDNQFIQKGIWLFKTNILAIHPGDVDTSIVSNTFILGLSKNSVKYYLKKKKRFVYILLLPK